jgi:hypothetical protein
MKKVPSEKLMFLRNSDPGLFVARSAGQAREVTDWGC